MKFLQDLPSGGLRPYAPSDYFGNIHIFYVYRKLSLSEKPLSYVFLTLFKSKVKFNKLNKSKRDTNLSRHKNIYPLILLISVPYFIPFLQEVLKWVKQFIYYHMTCPIMNVWFILLMFIDFFFHKYALGVATKIFFLENTILFYRLKKTEINHFLLNKLLSYCFNS